MQLNGLINRTKEHLPVITLITISLCNVQDQPVIAKSQFQNKVLLPGVIN